jgi:response regulator RpfG family c-di-GMP phosphodiesterase
MSGVEFLEQAIKLHPDAKRVLLTAYADTEAAIAAINEAGINHYLLKAVGSAGRKSLPGFGRFARRLARRLSSAV